MYEFLQKRRNSVDFTPCAVFWNYADLPLALQIFQHHLSTISNTWAWYMSFEFSEPEIPSSCFAIWSHMYHCNDFFHLKKIGASNIIISEKISTKLSW